MVDKRNRILQTEKHQNTGGDMSGKLCDTPVVKILICGQYHFPYRPGM